MAANYESTQLKVNITDDHKDNRSSKKFDIKVHGDVSPESLAKLKKENLDISSMGDIKNFISKVPSIIQYKE